MCTGFVRRGKDSIFAFNFDMAPGIMDYAAYPEKDRFYIGMKTAERMAEYNKTALSNSPMRIENGVRKLMGVTADGRFATMLGNQDAYKAPFRVAPEVYSLDQLADNYLSRVCDFDELKKTVEEKEIVCVPAPAEWKMAHHSLFADAAGRTLIVEPGFGHATLNQNFAVLTNFPILELPVDLCEDRYPYYGVDRYLTATRMLRETDDNFSMEDAWKILEACKGRGNWGTRISFVYSVNQNKLFWCEEAHFEEKRICSFEK